MSFDSVRMSLPKLKQQYITGRTAYLAKSKEKIIIKIGRRLWFILSSNGTYEVGSGYDGKNDIVIPFKEEKKEWKSSSGLDLFLGVLAGAMGMMVLYPFIFVFVFG